MSITRINANTRIAFIPDIGINIITPGGAAAAGWWNPDGSIGCCIAAYQPKGAADYAASKVNLANPGTYDATEGVAPTWDAVNGWMFNGATQYLDTGVVPPASQNRTIIVRYSNASSANAYVCGARTGTDQFGVVPRLGVLPQAVLYANGAGYFLAPWLATAVLGVSGVQPYRNGIAEPGAIAAGAVISAYSLYLGARNNNGAVDSYQAHYMQAIAIYSCTLTAPQVALVSAAMGSL